MGVVDWLHLLRRNFRLPLWLDRTLRGVRYLLLGFFLWAILSMTAAELQSFIQSPYNRVALVGLVGWWSPARVHRNHDRCIQCGLCDRVCMARPPVSGKKTVGGVECTGCLDCVAVCPVEQTLEMRAAGRRWPPLAYGFAIDAPDYGHPGRR